MKKLFLALTLVASTSAFGQALPQTSSALPPPQTNEAGIAKGQAMRIGVSDQITDSVTLFRLFDADKDGKISSAEAKALGISEANFKKLDTNGDNAIDQKEFERVAIILL